MGDPALVDESEDDAHTTAGDRGDWQTGRRRGQDRFDVACCAARAEEVVKAASERSSETHSDRNGGIGPSGLDRTKRLAADPCHLGEGSLGHLALLASATDTVIP